ncbi:MAG: methyl-accepting chemotaxis protein, partial [Rectinemataceae bacterium]|nr:methyl-accepting chemotaxis protein [Rectinemataceae bacterium]
SSNPLEDPSETEGTWCLSGLGERDSSIIQKPKVNRPYLRSVASHKRISFILLQQWEGRVIQVSANDFTAIVADKTNTSNDDEEIVFDIEDVLDEDRELITPGAVFYWSIGYDDSSGSRRRVSQILFRRLPGLSNREIKEAEKKALEFANVFQVLAEGSTEQASSLEQTSAALEEITSMSKQNADNANHANSLARDTRQEAEKGSTAMGEMIEAMKAINKSSQEISKIIKVIEEIAFQTNLLALNAAVEAARAGEHGKGFAVVAEEVRNLAQRAGGAAKDTASLIEDAVKKAGSGGEIANRAAKTLGDIVTNVKKVTDLVAEISAASDEQAKGVSQVSVAVTEMDKVTQQNASNAEETATASEELFARVESINVKMRDLHRLIQGVDAPGAVKTKPLTKSVRRLS